MKMNINNLNWITVLLLVLNWTGVTDLSYWWVFMPSIVWLGIFLLVLGMALTIIVANGISIAEFNKLMEDKKKNK
ncbi:MAG TPA: hypothetical protein DEB42_00500 [Jeotgalicoccus sp.]|nr:hypothetical protein [Jeotgalicoccus sp.]